MVFLWFSDGFPMVYRSPWRQIGASGPWRPARLALGGPPRRPAASLPDLHGLAAERPGEGDVFGKHGIHGWLDKVRAKIYVYIYIYFNYNYIYIYI